MKSESTDLTTFKVDDETEFQSWYRPVKNIPLRLVNGEVQSAIFPNNNQNIIDHWDVCIKTIEKFLSSGAIKLMSRDYVPLLSSSFVLANAKSTHKKPRACMDGGAYKILEAYKTACKLDGLPEVTQVLKPGFMFGKIDDSSGMESKEQKRPRKVKVEIQKHSQFLGSQDQK